MANLIIKSTAGNDLVIQGGDASPAITVGNTGTTTFAENATLSGTGNVYGQGTFPAGHVIQTLYKQNEAQSMENSSGSTATSTEVALAITTLKTNSKIHFAGTSMGAHCQNTAKGRVWLQRAITGGATTQIEEGKLIQSYYNRASDSGDSYSQYEPLKLEYVDSPSVAAGTVITYSARYTHQAGGGEFYWVHTSFGVLVIIQEIAV